MLLQEDAGLLQMVALVSLTQDKGEKGEPRIEDTLAGQMVTNG